MDHGVLSILALKWVSCVRIFTAWISEQTLCKFQIESMTLRCDLPACLACEPQEQSCVHRAVLQADVWTFDFLWRNFERTVSLVSGRNGVRLFVRSHGLQEKSMYIKHHCNLIQELCHFLLHEYLHKGICTRHRQVLQANNECGKPCEGTGTQDEVVSFPRRILVEHDFVFLL